MIQIKTKAYGPLEINSEDIVQFKEGLFAFEQYKKFALVTREDGSTFHWLQSLDEENLAFLVIQPSELFEDYVPVISTDSLKLVEAESLDEVEIHCMFAVPANQPEKMTINLQGPVVIHPVKKLGAQLISNDEKHPVKLPIFELFQNVAT